MVLSSQLTGFSLRETSNFDVACVASRSPHKAFSPDVECMWFAHSFYFSDGLEEEIGFVWDGSHLLQEVHPDGRYTYLYTDPDSYEPLAQVHNRTNMVINTL